MVKRVRVEGKEETLKAFHDFEKNLDFARAAANAGEAMLPDVKALTRRKTGAMQSSWDVEEIDEKRAAFTNDMFYAGWQEFGTENVEPTLAVNRAWSKNESEIVGAYEDEIERAAQAAGF